MKKIPNKQTEGLPSQEHERSKASRIPSWITWNLIVISFIGFLDAMYLTVQHYTGSSINCVIFEGCDTVATSKYAVIFGILPLALLGVFYYVSVLMSSLLYFDTGHKFFLRILPILTTLGFLFSLYFIYLQLFVIKAVCTYCMLSALTSTTLFIISLFILKHKKYLAEDK